MRNNPEKLKTSTLNLYATKEDAIEEAKFWSEKTIPIQIIIKERKTKKI